MKKFVFSITLLFAAAAVFAVAQPVARVTDLSMKSQYFNHERQVLIYTSMANEIGSKRSDWGKAGPNG